MKKIFFTLSLAFVFTNASALEKEQSQPVDVLFKIKYDCFLEDKIVPKTEEEYTEEVEKMKRLHRKEEDADRVKYFKEENCLPVKFCQNTNAINNFVFNKEEFKSHVDNSDDMHGSFSIYKSTIKLISAKFADSQKLLVQRWDKEFNVRAFLYKGKSYSLSSCGHYLEALKAKNKKIAEVKAKHEKDLEKEAQDRELQEKRRLERIRKIELERKHFEPQVLKNEKE